MSDNPRKEKAKELLIHYLSFGLEAMGSYVNSDNRVEIEEIVDLIVDAAVFEIREEIRRSRLPNE